MGYFGIPFRNGVPIGLGSVVSFGAQQFDPSELFVGGTAGAWYDPSDLTTMFTTSAGTTQCAMPGQGSAVSVGRMLDKSGNGNHAIAFNNTTARPELRARVNLLVATATLSTQSVTTQATSYTLSFAGTGSITLSGTATGSYNAGTHTITCTAGTLTLTVSGAVTTADLRPANSGALLPAYQAVVDANTYDTSGFPLYLRFDGIDDSMYTPASIPFATVTSDGQARRNLLNNPTQFDVTTSWAPIGTAPTVTANATTAPDGTATADRLVFSASGIGNRLAQTLGAATGAVQIQLSVYLRGNVGGEVMQVSDGWTSSGNFTLTTEWQRFVFSTTGNATSTGFLLYANSGTPTVFAWGAQLETGSTATAFQNIGTDKMAVFAGVRKLSDAAQGVVAELSATIASNNGTFLLAAPDGATQTYGWDSKGTTQVDAVASSLAAPRTNVLVGTADIAGDSCIIRVNGAVADTEAGDQGTGNYGTYPLFIGARNNASLWFNGHLHSLIIAGSAVSAGNISATEQWVAGKTGITI